MVKVLRKIQSKKILADTKKYISTSKALRLLEKYKIKYAKDFQELSK